MSPGKGSATLTLGRAALRANWPVGLYQSGEAEAESRICPEGSSKQLLINLQPSTEASACLLPCWQLSPYAPCPLTPCAPHCSPLHSQAPAPSFPWQRTESLLDRACIWSLRHSATQGVHAGVAQFGSALHNAPFLPTVLPPALSVALPERGLERTHSLSSSLPTAPTESRPHPVPASQVPGRPPPREAMGPISRQSTERTFSQCESGPRCQHV